MRSQIGWEEMTLTVTTNVFKTIKDVVLRIIASAHLQREILIGDAIPLLISPTELRMRILAANPDLEFTDEQMLTAVGHLAKHGYITLLRKSSQEQTILLTPSRLTSCRFFCGRSPSRSQRPGRAGRSPRAGGRLSILSRSPI